MYQFSNPSSDLADLTYEKAFEDLLKFIIGEIGNLKEKAFADLGGWYSDLDDLTRDELYEQVWIYLTGVPLSNLLSSHD